MMILLEYAWCLITRQNCLGMETNKIQEIDIFVSLINYGNLRKLGWVVSLSFPHFKIPGIFFIVQLPCSDYCCTELALAASLLKQLFVMDLTL